MTREATISAYKTAMKLYLQFTGMTPRQLVDEAVEDFQRPLDKRTDIVKIRIKNFNRWLLARGSSECTGSAYCGSIRGFYSVFGIATHFRRCEKIPTPRVQDPRYPLTASDVRQLVDHSESVRDRAIITVAFQSGMDVSTLCSLTYGQVRRGLEANEVPLKVDCVRPKTRVAFFTFIGKDGIAALRAYIDDFRFKGVFFQDNTPLFLTASFKGPPIGIKPINIENAMRRTAMKAGMVKPEQVDRHHHNPVGPHGLRESFGSILSNKGIPTAIVNFLLGHQMNRLDEVYMRPREAEIRQLYVGVEPFISISQSSQTVLEVKEKVNSWELVVADLVQQNRALKEKLDKVSQATEVLQFQLNVIDGLERAPKVIVEDE
ncbi:MAG TPA: tyrosine-type recombinase/integrase [Conexivisphaerales archaeon]|nr:tyrosine-type recombinase/integrase [Conexivisphaerales archaeon]